MTPQATAPATQTAVGVHIAHLDKSFGARAVLRDVSLDVTAGTTTCIIGRSGSGKSTLLRCINGLETADRGEIGIGGATLRPDDRSLNALRSRVGMVFQHFNLFPNHDVLGNVTLALRRVHGMSRHDAEERATRALDRVGMLSFARSHPDRLSGGQQQRVAIARAIAPGPSVMLFDEATSALDPELVKGVLGLMRALADEGMTMVVVTHEMAFARQVSDQVAFISDGTVAVSGAPDTVFEHPEHPALRRFLDQVL